MRCSDVSQFNQSYSSYCNFEPLPARVVGLSCRTGAPRSFGLAICDLERQSVGVTSRLFVSRDPLTRHDAAPRSYETKRLLHRQSSWFRSSIHCTATIDLIRLSGDHDLSIFRDPELQIAVRLNHIKRSPTAARSLDVSRPSATSCYASFVQACRPMNRRNKVILYRYSYQTGSGWCSMAQSLHVL